MCSCGVKQCQDNPAGPASPSAVVLSVVGIESEFPIDTTAGLAEGNRMDAAARKQLIGVSKTFMLILDFNVVE